MEIVLEWIHSAWSDFGRLSPTSQISFLIAGLTFIAALVAGTWKLVVYLRRGRNRAQLSEMRGVGDERARILKLIEAGNVSAKDALELARLLYGGANSTLDSVDASPLNTDNEVQIVSSLTEGDEERRAFAAIVTEFATSEHLSDRAVILQYARGDRSAAIATLAARARAAGADGAELWREVATLALPFDRITAVEALGKAAEIDVTDVVSLCRLSSVLSRTSDLPGALKAAEQALERAEDDSLRGRALSRMAAVVSSMGDIGKASELAARSVAAARKGAAERPDDTTRARVLANAYEMMCGAQLALGSPIEANANLDRAVTLYEHLLKLVPDDEEVALDRIRAIMTQGYLDRIAGNPAASIDRFEALLLEIKQAVADHPDNLWFAEMHATALLQSAYSLDDLCREKEALDAASGAEELAQALIAKDRAQSGFRKTRLFAQVLRTRVLARQGQIEEALQARDTMLASARKDIAIDTDDVRRNLAVALVEDGNLRKDLGDMLGAGESYQEAHEILETIAEADPKDVNKQEEVLLSAWKLAEFANLQDDQEEYHRLAKDTLERAQALCQANPAIRKLKFDVAYGERIMASACISRQDDPAVLRHADAACVLYKELAAANPDDFDACHHAIDSQRFHAATLVHLGRAKDGLALAEKALAGYAELASTPEKIARLAALKSNCLSLLGTAYQTFGDFSSADRSRRESVDVLRQRYEAAPEVRSRRSALVRALTDYGKLLSAAGRNQEALERFEEALPLCVQDSNEENREQRTDELVLRYCMAACYKGLGNSDQAARLEKTGLALAEDLARVAGDINAQSNLANAYSAQTTNAIIEGRWGDAQEWQKKARRAADKVQGNARLAQKLFVTLTNQDLDIAIHFGDKPAMKRHIDKLVELAEEAEAEQTTLDGRFALCDLLLRQAALHNEFGKANDYLPKAHEALVDAEAGYPDNELARSKLVSTWDRIGRIYQGLGQYAMAIDAFKRSLGHRPTESDNQNALGIANTRGVLANSYMAIDDIGNASQELTRLDALIPAIEASFDRPRYAIYQKFAVASERVRIALFTGSMVAAREHARDAMCAAGDLERELPDHSDPVVKRFEAAVFEFEALDIEMKLDMAGPVLEQVQAMLPNIKKVISDERTIVGVEAYIGYLRCRIHNACGLHDQALSGAAEWAATLQSAFDAEATAFRLNLLGNLRQAAAEAANGSGQTEKAVALQSQAVADFRFLAKEMPESKQFLRYHLRSLYELACITEQPEAFETVAKFMSSPQIRDSLPAHYPWVKRLQADERV